MPESLDELLHALRTAGPEVDKGSLGDEIRILIEEDPEGSRPVILRYADDEVLFMWALGLLGDPADDPDEHIRMVLG